MLDLKCDNCDYCFKVEAMDERFIGHPCPECGANMCTQEDYDAAKKILALLDCTNKLGLTRYPKLGEQANVSLNPHENKLTVELINQKSK